MSCWAEDLRVAPSPRPPAQAHMGLGNTERCGRSCAEQLHVCLGTKGSPPPFLFNIPQAKIISYNT